MVSSLPLGKVGGENIGKASRSRSANTGIILANQMKQKIEHHATAQRAKDGAITLGSRPSELTMKTNSQGKTGWKKSTDQAMPRRRHFDVGLIGAVVRPVFTVILPQEQDSVVSTKLEKKSLDVIVNQHTWTSDPVAARKPYNLRNGNRSTISDDDEVFCMEHRKPRKGDDTLATDDTESYDGTVDETSTYYDSVYEERLRKEVEEDWITRPRSPERFSCLCCMPGEFY
jgi:hypothetical protein